MIYPSEDDKYPDKTFLVFFRDGKDSSILTIHQICQSSPAGIKIFVRVLNIRKSVKQGFALLSALQNLIRGDHHLIPVSPRQPAITA